MQHIRICYLKSSLIGTRCHLAGYELCLGISIFRQVIENAGLSPVSIAFLWSMLTIEGDCFILVGGL